MEVNIHCCHHSPSPRQNDAAPIAAHEALQRNPEGADNKIHSRDPWKYALGVFFVVMVSVLWVLSSVLVQYVFSNAADKDDNHTEKEDPLRNSTFLVTYVGSSAFVVLLPWHFLCQALATGGLEQDASSSPPSPSLAHNSTADLPTASDWQTMEADYQPPMATFPLHYYTDNTQETGRLNDTSQQEVSPDTKMQGPSRSLIASSSPTAGPLLATAAVGEPDETSTSWLLSAAGSGASHGPEHQQLSPTLPFNEDDNNNHPVSLWQWLVEAHVSSTKDSVVWTFQQHLKTAFLIAPGWFLTNWFYNVALQRTSLTSTTVLVSTNGVFAFLVGDLWLGMQAPISPTDGSHHLLQGRYRKMTGVILSVVGTVLTALKDATFDDSNQDGDVDGHDELFGDFFALLSAVGFGVYSVQVDVLCPSNESLYNMELVLGCLGLVLQLGLTPIVLLLFPSVVVQCWMFSSTRAVLGLLLLRGFLDYVVSEYLFFRAVVLTDATVASVGLGLVIPLGFLADAIFAESPSPPSWLSVAGAVTVLVGFVLVNLQDPHKQEMNQNPTPQELLTTSSSAFRHYQHQSQDVTEAELT